MGRFKSQTTVNTVSYNKCVVGLDRDGTINKDLGTYVSDPDNFIPIEKSLEAVALIRSKGHKIVIITNQGGIQKGILSESQIQSVHNKMFRLLGQAGCPSIDGLYYSASSLRSDLYAKPNIGMFEQAEKEIPGVNFSKGFYVGDKISDLKAAYKIGATPILVRTGYGIETEQLLKKFTNQKIAKRTKIYNNLWEFAQAL